MHRSESVARMCNEELHKKDVELTALRKQCQGDPRRSDRLGCQHKAKVEHLPKQVKDALERAQVTEEKYLALWQEQANRKLRLKITQLQEQL